MTILKYFKIILILLFANSTIAQDYQVVKEDGAYYFEPEEELNTFSCMHGKFFHCIKIDSIASLANGNIFYNMKELHNEDFYQSDLVPWDNYPDSNCFQPRISWIGERIEIQPDGNNYFFNRNNDSILIRSNSNEGDSWEFFDFGNGNTIKATDMNHTTLNFIGVVDSVKIIILQTEDINGNIIQSEFNDLEIILSKNNGIIKAINFRDFPEYEYSFKPINWNICGLPNNTEGARHLTRREVYDFQIDDEFHYTESWYGFPIKKTIINKTFSPDSTEVTYEIKRVHVYPDTIPPDSFGFTPHIDYITETYSDLDSLIIPDTLLPFESINPPSYELGNDFFMHYELGKQISITTPGESFFDYQTCQDIYFPFEHHCYHNTYVEGCGSWHINYYWYDPGYYELVYCKNGNQSYGNPATFWSNSETQPSENNLIVYPNPNNGIFTIRNYSFDNASTVSVYSSLGKIIFKKNNYKGESINLGLNPTGVYLLKLTTDTGIYFQKLIIH